MCAPIILGDAAIGLAAAHILGIGLMAGLVVFNSNGARKGISSLLGAGSDATIGRVITLIIR